MVIQRETRFCINLSSLMELIRCNITIKTSYKNLPVSYWVQHYIYTSVCVYEPTVCHGQKVLCYSSVIYVNTSQIYSEFFGISSWINFELKLLFSIYLCILRRWDLVICVLALPWVPAGSKAMCLIFKDGKVRFLRSLLPHSCETWQLLCWVSLMQQFQMSFNNDQTSLVEVSFTQRECQTFTQYNHSSFSKTNFICYRAILPSLMVPILNHV